MTKTNCQLEKVNYDMVAEKQDLNGRAKERTFC